MTDAPMPQSERDKTDESLQLERDRVDRVFDDEVSDAEEMADAVIRRARSRADALLAAARATSDCLVAPVPSTDVLKTSRRAEDRALQRERATADQALQDSRAGQTTFLSDERGATDESLSLERARADQALAARDEFLGIVSHDLLNLLNAVVGISSLIEREVTTENHVERVAAHARRVQRSGVRMARLVGDLVDVASIEAGKLAVLRTVGVPADVVTEAVDTFQAEAGQRQISLSIDVGPDVPSIAFDSARILQVLCNLIANALKFTPEQGTIVVRLERLGEDVVCRVIDSGDGIPEDKLEAVFDRFVQLTPHDRRGVGLGLFIARCIVQGHGGRIWVENGADRGCTFSFILPVAAQAPVAPHR